MDVDYSMVRFVGNLVLNLWDCGGQERPPRPPLLPPSFFKLTSSRRRLQEAFFQSYFDSQKDHIFKNVEVHATAIAIV